MLESVILDDIRFDGGHTSPNRNTLKKLINTKRQRKLVGKTRGSEPFRKHWHPGVGLWEADEEGGGGECHKNGE